MSTDSILLGAVAQLDGSMNILDIGTGTGVIALMLAQKHSEAIVDAVEKDIPSAEEARANFESSPWSYRMTCYAQSFESFYQDETLHYDLIVSNPPYFESIVTAKSKHKDWPGERRLEARTIKGLSFEALTEGVAKILVSYGKFFLILPAEQEDKFLTIAESNGLFHQYRLAIEHMQNSGVHRLILGLGKQKIPVVHDALYLKNTEGSWSENYLQRTANFHLWT